MSKDEIDSYVEMLRALRAEAVKLGEGLDTDVLNWKPAGGETNSIYQLLTHIAGSEAWWLHQIVGGVDIHRDRPSEFAAGGDDAAALTARIESVARRSEDVLRGLSGTDLAATHETTQGRRSARWCILHVIEHTARHIGHIELTRQMWQARKVA